MTHSRAALSRILDEEGIHPSKALGQNFVADANTVRRIARLAKVGPEDRVVEIGAGLGSLTLALAETGATVVAVEKDLRLAPIVREMVSDLSHVHIVQGDALTLDWNRLFRDAAVWVLVANLPYNVATPLVITVLEDVPQVARMLVMVQKEAGERLIARPGDDAYGAVSVKIAYWAEARVVGKVPASVFLPRPNVESVLVSVERRDLPAISPEVVSYAQMCTLLHKGFATRRKMLRNSLLGVCDPDVFGRAGIDPTARAEELSVEEWGRLAAAAQEIPL